MSGRTVDLLRNSDPEFAEAEYEALEFFAHSYLGSVTHDYAVNGFPHHVLGKDGEMHEVRKFHPDLFKMYVKKHLPEYREDPPEQERTTEVPMLVRSDIDDMSPEDRASLEDILSRVQRRSEERDA